MTAAQVLPLVAVFGQKLHAPGVITPPQGIVDFRWEREWRYPNVKRDLKFSEKDVFMGLCPHEEVEEFENLWPGIGFFDPRRNIKWYSKKLTKARQRLGIKASVA